MNRKERYVSKEEKQTLKKDNKWAKFGKSLLKGAAFCVGGVGAAIAALSVGLPAVTYITAGAMFLLAKPIFGEVIDNFVNLFHKENDNTKGM